VDPELELLAPLDDPELLPPELVLPEPPPLLDPPLDPPSRPELSDPEPELPHEAISPAVTKAIDATAVFMVRLRNNPRSSPCGNPWKSER